MDKIPKLVIIVIICLITVGCINQEGSRRVTMKSFDVIIDIGDVGESRIFNTTLSGEGMVFTQFFSVESNNVTYVLFLFEWWDNQPLFPDEFQITVTPPEGISASFDPAHQVSGFSNADGYGEIQINATVDTPPGKVEVQAGSLEEANAIAAEIYNSSKGNGEWSVVIDYIGDGRFNSDDEADTSLSCTSMTYRLLWIKEKE